MNNDDTGIIDTDTDSEDTTFNDLDETEDM